MADLGTDFSCVFGLDPRCIEVSGRTGLAQAVARRLITPRGRLIRYPNYGYDLRQFLNADLSPSELAQIQTQATAECLKDERVKSASVAASLDINGKLTVEVTIDDGDGPFAFVLNVADLTIDLLNTQL